MRHEALKRIVGGKKDFNSRTSCEVRHLLRRDRFRIQIFQLTHLLRGATLSRELHLDTREHFNSRTSCEVRPHLVVGDAAIADFNSRTSCEVRRKRPRSWGAATTFQLTHLLRGATESDGDASPDGHDFNSRTSCEVRRATGPGVGPGAISTHAPLARCDAPRTGVSVVEGFQLTHLLRGATWGGRYGRMAALISTHAPLARCDYTIRNKATKDGDFNSRTSCEVRHDVDQDTMLAILISTHAPLARCDTAAVAAGLGRAYFNSRTSCEVRRCSFDICRGLRISTHAPLARCD